MTENPMILELEIDKWLRCLQTLVCQVHNHNRNTSLITPMEISKELTILIFKVAAQPVYNKAKKQYGKVDVVRLYSLWDYCRVKLSSNLDHHRFSCFHIG